MLIHVSFELTMPLPVSIWQWIAVGLIEQRDLVRRRVNLQSRRLVVRNSINASITAKNTSVEEVAKWSESNDPNNNT